MPEEIYVKTNIGDMPLIDYYEIGARQCGYSNYRDMLKNGFHFDISDIDEKYLFTKGQRPAEAEQDSISQMLEAIIDNSGMVIDSIDEKTIKQIEKGDIEWEI